MNKMKSNAVKNLIKACSFLLILFIILNLLSAAFLPKNNTLDAGIDYESTYGYRAEEKDSLDIVSFGNSDLYSGLVPLQLFFEQGYTNYAAARPLESISNAYYTLMDVYKYQSPDLIILEVDCLFHSSEANDADDAITNVLYNYLPIFKYHDRWKNISLSEFTENVHYDHIVTNKGYIYHKTVEAYQGQDYMNNKKRKYMTTSTQIFLDKFVKLAKENGSEVMFVAIPSAKTWTNDKHKTVADYAKSNDIEFLDLNVEFDEAGMDWATDSRDGGNHLNYNGAKKATSYIGQFISQHYQIEDKRQNELYNQWEIDYQKFIKNK